MRVIGVDGCKGGWVAVERARAKGPVSIRVVSRVDDLFDASGPRVVAIDVPIGLMDRGARICDMLVRDELEERSSSVFPAPVRAVLRAKTYEDACDRSMRSQGKKISKQTWAIVPKIREVDALLKRRPELRDEVWEVHPEMSFAAWSGDPMQHSKKSPLGRIERHVLVEEHFGIGTFERLRSEVPRKSAGDDDIVDAFAALWTAERIAARVAISLPTPPEADELGLEMRITF